MSHYRIPMPPEQKRFNDIIEAFNNPADNEKPYYLTFAQWKDLYNTIEELKGRIRQLEKKVL